MWHHRPNQLLLSWKTFSEIICESLSHTRELMTSHGCDKFKIHDQQLIVKYILLASNSYIIFRDNLNKQKKKRNCICSSIYFIH